MFAWWNFNLWWSSLTGAEMVFWCIAIGASVLQVLFFIASFFAGSDFDHSFDGADSDMDMGAKFLSVRAIIAFLVGFGWTGGLFMKQGYSLGASLIAAMVAGILVMGLVFLIMRGMMSLRDDGNLDFQNAIDLHGQVYVTIPPAMSGRGQIEILLQGRLLTLQAVTKYHSEIPPQTPVRVDAIEAGNLLVVSPII